MGPRRRRETRPAPLPGTLAPEAMHRLDMPLRPDRPPRHLPPRISIDLPRTRWQSRNRMQPKRGISTVKAGLATELTSIRLATLQGHGPVGGHGDCPPFVAAAGDSLWGRAASALGAVPAVLCFGIGPCPA
jgi:hypothetical protein